MSNKRMVAKILIQFTFLLCTFLPLKEINLKLTTSLNSVIFILALQL